MKLDGSAAGTLFRCADERKSKNDGFVGVEHTLVEENESKKAATLR